MQVKGKRRRLLILELNDPKKSLAVISDLCHENEEHIPSWFKAGFLTQRAQTYSGWSSRMLPICLPVPNTLESTLPTLHFGIGARFQDVPTWFDNLEIPPKPRAVVWTTSTYPIVIASQTSISKTSQSGSMYVADTSNAVFTLLKH
eukprot:Blabericola_migrator_1__10253@NODE_573_length_7510_cov_308_719602_g427_i0_p6_GENE_NODE_573_length_7510_cov_308_719602_g427_i0NODE_573_length_7510_cov_308_719602_g427_i0_p6_ORF_typecomplete_len146_score2_86_NODE_573_length_7510_cov_308_719602_g427_i011801617